MGETATTGRTLGSELRGGRLGYHWFDPVRAYMRISDTAEGFVVELAPSLGPPHAVLVAAGSARERVDDNSAEIRSRLSELLPAVLAGGHRVIRVRSYMRLVFNDEGRLLRA